MATIAASIHEDNASQMSVHRGPVKGLPKKSVAQQSGRAPPAPQELLRPHRSGVPEKIVPTAAHDVKGPFMVILRGIKDYDPYLQCRPDVIGTLGFTSY
jgi:hypothetical protein